MENAREVSTAAKQVLGRRLVGWPLRVEDTAFFSLCVCVPGGYTSGCVRRVDRILTEAFWGARGMVQGVSMRGGQGEICQDNGAQSSVPGGMTHPCVVDNLWFGFLRVLHDPAVLVLRRRWLLLERPVALRLVRRRRL